MGHQKLEDSDLLVLLQKGDNKAFKEIYNRYWDKLYTIGYMSLGSREETEDIIQNIFTTLWNSRTSLNILKLSTYLTVCVKNASYNFIKSQISFRKYQEFLILHELKDSNLTEQIVNYENLQSAIDQALKKLPEKTVEIFKMSRFSNKSVKEIAEELNLTEKAVEYHITKSLKALKIQLQDFTNLN